MNEKNYGSLEACRKLIEAGIVLETDAVWRKNRDKRVQPEYYLSRRALYRRTSDISAPTLAEVWRELPTNTWLRKDYTGRTNIMNEDNSYNNYNTNPTDALIYLLIWARARK